MGFLTRILHGLARASGQTPDAPKLTEAEVARIQESFLRIRPISKLAAEIFYTRLFEIAPEVRPLFKGDPGSPEMAEQGAKLIAMLSVIVNGLDNLDALAPSAAALAKRHVGYGARPEHYEKVGLALLITLKEGLGDVFTPEVEAAWEKAYAILSSAMIAAAHPEHRKAA